MHLDGWSSVILGFAKKVFLVLGSIEITIALARSYYQEGGTFDRVTAVLLERMLFLGFWATLLFWGTPAIWNLIESFQRLGSSATGVDLNPTGIFEQGLTMTLDLMALSFEEGILESTALFFPLTILAIVFVFATAEVVGALIDAYVIASAGIVVLGLGGSRWTSPIAQNYLRYALGAGIHLMVVNLVAAVGLKVLIDISAVIKDVGDEGATGLMAVVLYVTGAALLFAYLLRRVPATVSSIVSGAVSADSGGAVIAAAASGAHMGATAAMMTAAPAARFGLGAVATGEHRRPSLPEAGKRAPGPLDTLLQGERRQAVRLDKATDAPGPKERTPMSPTPFEMAIRVHEDRYGSLQTSASRWRLVALSLLALLAVCIVGMTTMALRSRVTPYVVQVDQHGYEVMIGPAEEASPADQRIVIAQLGQFFRNYRTVLPETHAQEELVRRVMAMVASGSPAATKATAFYRELGSSPSRRRVSIDCEVKAVLPMAEDTWQVDWSEHRYESGSLVGTKHFKAVVTVDVEPTRAMAQVLSNPLGIYVVDFNVTELG